MLTLHKIVGGRSGAYAAYLTSIEDTGDYYVGPHGDPWAMPGTVARQTGDRMGTERTGGRPRRPARSPRRTGPEDRRAGRARLASRPGCRP